MSNLGNKEIMAKNIRHYMDLNGVKPKDVCDTLKFPMPTFSDWINAKTYPRIDKIEMMANYFGVSKADLVEEHRDDTDVLKAALWGGDKDFTPEDLDEMWADVQNFAAYIASQRKKEKK